MKAKLQKWYRGLEERERLFVNIGAVAAVVLILAGVILPLNGSIFQARQRIAAKQVDLAYIQSATPQLASAGPSMGARHGRIPGGNHRQFGARKRSRQVVDEQPAHRRRRFAHSSRSRAL